MSTGVYRVSYLGQTVRSFYNRNKEHLIQKLGGNYQICDPEAMINGRHEVVWNGMWRKGTRDKLPEFLAQYERLAPIIKRSILVTKLFVAPLKVERRICQRIEGALAVAIKSDAEASSLLPKDIRYILKKENEEPILVTIESEQLIEGLPKEVYA
jgi:hypothetical protein